MSQSSTKDDKKWDKDKYSLANPSKKMKQVLKDNIMVETLPFTLLIEGVPEALNEDHIRNCLVKDIIEKYHLQPSEIGRIEYFSNFSVYRIVMNSVQDCEFLAGKTVNIKDKTYLLYRPPIHIPPVNDILSAKRTTRQSLSNQGRKKRKLNKEEEFDESSESSEEIQSSSSESTKASQVKSKKKKQILSDKEYTIESILDQQWYKDKTQLVVKLKDVDQPLKLWLMNDNILKLFELNRKYKDDTKSLDDIKINEFPIIEEVVGADKRNNQLFLWVKWQNCDIKSLLPASAVNIIAPEKVIQFYEGKLVFENNKSD